MRPIASHLRKIDNSIKTKPDDYTKYVTDYTIIQNYMLNALRDVDAAFAYLFVGATLTGSIPLSLRINVPNEFDVLLNIAFPQAHIMHVQYMPEYPGFLQINLKNLMHHLFHTASVPFHVYCHLQKLIDPRNFLLCREKLQYWLHYAFQRALEVAGNRVVGYNYLYKLTYKQNGISHTIYARSQHNEMFIKIDFVPAVIFSTWAAPNRILFATPRGAFCASLYTRNHSFFICNATAEIEHFINAPANVRVVARLLKFTYNRRQMPRFKSYFITTALLWEMHQPISFWQQPLDVLYCYMLEKLLRYLEACYLPFFWDKRFNFMCYLTNDDCKNYQKELREGAKMLMSKPKLPDSINCNTLNDLTSQAAMLNLKEETANVKLRTQSP